MYRLEEDEDAEDNVFLRGFDRIELKSRNHAQQQQRRKLLKYGMAGAAITVALVLIIGLSVGLAKKSSQPYACKDEGGAAYGLTFYVIGDWGRQGNANQRRAAQMMADVAGCMRPAFIVSTGDNFYDHGLKSASDPNIQQSFTNVYNQPALQVNWYAVQGNHDYADGINPASNKDCAANSLDACPSPDCCYSPAWQYTGRFNDMRWHSQNGSFNVPTGDGRLLDIVTLDTSPFIARYKAEPWFNNAGGLHQQDTGAIKSRMRALLASSKARWKLVVGHHPIASFGEHCAYSISEDCNEMAWLDQELQDAGVAAYLCGHDHDLQYITKTAGQQATATGQPAWPVYVVSGAGSNIRTNEFAQYKARAGYNLGFMADDQGFVAVRANSSHLVLHYYTSSRALPAYTAVLAAK